METLIAIDFDGVISPIDRDYDFTTDSDFVIIRLGGFNCAIRKETLEFLQKISVIPNLKVVWFSSWGEETECFVEDSDNRIPEFDWINVREGKAEAVFNYAEANNFTKIVAVDDHMKVVSALKRISKNHEDIETLFIKPMTKKGITSLQIKKILKFIV